MTFRQKLSNVTVDEYLDLENTSSVRHEYVDGHLFAMTGSTRRHNLIAGNLYTIFRRTYRGGPCRAYLSDLKVRVKATNSFYYPDVMVSCDYFDSKSVYTDSPNIIVEVLSASTASIDRREKLIAYKQIESLNEYLIVHQRTRHVTLYRREDADHWLTFEFDSGDTLVIESIPGKPVAISVDDIYEDVTFTGDDDSALELKEDVENYDYAYELDW